MPSGSPVQDEEAGRRRTSSSRPLNRSNTMSGSASDIPDLKRGNSDVSERRGVAFSLAGSDLGSVFESVDKSLKRGSVSARSGSEGGLGPTRRRSMRNRKQTLQVKASERRSASNSFRDYAGQLYDPLELWREEQGGKSNRSPETRKRAVSTNQRRTTSMIPRARGDSSIEGSPVEEDEVNPIDDAETSHVSLMFKDEMLEFRYVNEYIPTQILFARAFTYLAIIIWIVVTAAEAIREEGNTRWILLGIRLASLPIAIAALIMCHNMSLFEKYFEFGMLLAMWSLATAAQVAGVIGENLEIRMGSLTIAVTCFLMFIGTRFVYTCFGVAAIGIQFLIMGGLTLAWERYVALTVLLVLAVTIGLTAKYFNELYSRRSFVVAWSILLQRELTHLEQDHTEELLLNVLPEQVAERLQSNNMEKISDKFNCVTILFCDVYKFNEKAAAHNGPETVRRLNRVFSVFDNLCLDLGCEKIKTIGSVYMVGAGLPIRSDDHAAVLSRLAIAMMKSIDSISERVGFKIELMMGMHSGPCVAGIIGTAKFTYDLWGDAVNTASRMESHGLPNKIQISEATADLIRDDFVIEERGVIPVKGKGDMRTYFILGEKGEEPFHVGAETDPGGKLEHSSSQVSESQLSEGGKDASVGSDLHRVSGASNTSSIAPPPALEKRPVRRGVMFADSPPPLSSASSTAGPPTKNSSHSSVTATNGDLKAIAIDGNDSDIQDDGGGESVDEGDQGSTPLVNGTTTTEAPTPKTPGPAAKHPLALRGPRLGHHRAASSPNPGFRVKPPPSSSGLTRDDSDLGTGVSPIPVIPAPGASPASLLGGGGPATPRAKRPRGATILELVRENPLPVAGGRQRRQRARSRSLVPGYLGIRPDDAKQGGSGDDAGSDTGSIEAGPVFLRQRRGTLVATRPSMDFPTPQELGMLTTEKAAPGQDAVSVMESLQPPTALQRTGSLMVLAKERERSATDLLKDPRADEEERQKQLPETTEQEEYRLRFHPWTLRFEHGDVEADFQDYVFQNARLRILNLFAILLFMTGAFFLCDALLAEDFTPAPVYSMMIALLALYFVILLLTGHRIFPQILTPAILSYGAVLVAYIGVVVWSSDRIGYASFRVALLACYVYSFVRIRYIPKIAFNVIVTIFTLAVEYGKIQSTGNELSDAVSVLIMSNIMGTFSAFVSERQNRNEYQLILALRQEQQTLRTLSAMTEKLLYNSIPRRIAKRLKASDVSSIAEEYHEAGILYTDIVSFTTLSSTKTAAEVVNLLNLMFVRFDELADKYHIEKIKTIGDAYMCAALPGYAEEHAICEMALDMRAHVMELNRQKIIPENLAIRIGVNIGPVVAGVIGHNKYIYDMWGPEVTMANKLEETGAADEIHVAQIVAERMANRFDFESCGVTQIDGRGYPTHFLKRRKDRVEEMAVPTMN